MFASFIKAAAVTAMLAVGVISGTAATATKAEAGGATIEFRFGHGPSATYRHAPRYARDFCDPRRAVNKASRMGLRRAHVVRNAPRRVAVVGFDRGHRVRVIFANERGCPVIGYR